MSNRPFSKIRHQACELANDDFFPNAFPYLCLRIFFPQMNDDQIESALAGLGSNDDSIDAYWVDDSQKSVNIAQFKSSESEPNGTDAKKDWFSYLSDIEERMADLEYVGGHKNERIRREIGYDLSFRVKEGYQINLFLFHLGWCNENTLGHYSQKITYFDYDSILEKLEEYDSIYENTDPAECIVNVDMFATSNPSEKAQVIRYSPTNRYSTVVTLISGFELVKLRDENKFKVFDRNVRYYLGTANKINKEIYETAKNKPDNFYYFNNGITITCFKCRDSLVNNVARLKLELPQIINGAQTVNAIYEAYRDLLKRKKAELGSEEKALRECEKHFKRIKVLCRIIESTKHDETDFATNLTKYNNSQNSVKLTDFFSNRPEQIELQKKLLDYGFFYERKRGERNDPDSAFLKENNTSLSALKYRDVQLDLKTVAAALQAYFGKTGSSDVGEKAILDENNGDYSRLFGNTRSEVTVERVKEIAFAVSIFVSVEYYAKRYNQLLRVLSALQENQNDEKKNLKYRSILADLDFLPQKLKRDLLDSPGYSETDRELIDRIYTYRLLTQGKYLLTALIHEILKLNSYKDDIFSNDLFANLEYIRNNIVKRWIGKILVRFVNPIREQDKDRRSDNAFFLDSNTFNLV